MLFIYRGEQSLKQIGEILIVSFFLILFEEI